MTNEEAIDILQEEHDWVQEPYYVIKAIEMAVSALRMAVAKNETTTQPDHIDREAWTGCQLCKRLGEKDPCYKDGCFKKSYPACDFRCDKFLDWRADRKKLEGSSFCPWCGRPLTPEAWAELEKRLRGER